MNGHAIRNVTFIGIGIMGLPMARHLLDAGYNLHIFTRTKEKALELLDAGATWHDRPADAAVHGDAVITMVGFPADVEEVYFEPDGILMLAQPGTLLIDMTTSSPQLARRIYKEATKRGLRAIDAPVTGGEVGAKEARLSILVGGDESDVASARPLLEHLGRSIVHHGGPGAGQHAKLANQIVIAATLAGVCEGLAYAKAADLDPERWLASISGGAAESFQLETLGPKILAGDYRPGFLVEHFHKDLTVASAESEALGLSLPCLDVVRAFLDRLVEDGGGKEGTQALFKAYQDDGKSE